MNFIVRDICQQLYVKSDAELIGHTVIKISPTLSPCAYSHVFACYWNDSLIGANNDTC